MPQNTYGLWLVKSKCYSIAAVIYDTLHEDSGPDQPANQGTLTRTFSVWWYVL